MASSEVTKGLMTEVAGQSIASAISAMGLSTIGNMSALTTTDKTSLVGAINEVKSGLTNVSGKVPIRGGFNIHCLIVDNASSVVSSYLSSKALISALS